MSMNLKKHQQNVLEKIQVTLCKCKRTTTPEDFEDANMLSGNRERRLKAIGCKPRARRKICPQVRKKGKMTYKASVTSAFNILHPFSWLY